MSNFLAWIKGAVSYLASFLTADRLALIGSIIQIILTAVNKVDEMGDMTDEAKRATAFGLLTEELPILIEYGVKLKKIEAETGKGCILPDGRIDSDCNGTADEDETVSN